MADANKTEFRIAEVDEVGLVDFIKSNLSDWGRLETVEQLRKALEPFYSKADREVLSVPANLRHQLDCMRQLASEGCWGWFDDDRAFVSDWGFEVAAIEVPVSIWHGDGDLAVPVAHSDWMAKRIPGARLHLLPDEGHISLLEHHYGRMLDELIEIGC